MTVGQGVVGSTAVLHWSSADVAVWLCHNGLVCFVELLTVTNRVDGKDLLHIGESDLRKLPLCDTLLRHLPRLMLCVDHLQTNCNCRSFHSNTYGHSRSGSFTSDCSTSWSHCSLTSLPVHQTHTYLTSHRVTSHRSSMDVAAEHGGRSVGGYPVSHQLPSDLRKLVLSYLYMMVVSFCECFMAVVSNIRLPDPKQYPPLPDIVLESLPFMPWAFHWAELITLLMGATMVVVVLFHKHRFIIMRRLFVLTGSISTIRAISIVITSVPVSSTHMPCEKQSYDDLWSMVKRSLTILLGAGLTMNGVYNCGDFIFSGHTVVLTILNYFIVEYTPRRMRLLHFISWTACLSAMYFIMASREHYSVDVFLAFFVTTQLFVHYHSLADCGAATRTSDRLLSRLWIPLFNFFEASIDGVVPNEYELPLRGFLTNVRQRWGKHHSGIRSRVTTNFSAV